MCAGLVFLSVSMYASAFIADYGSSECWCLSDCDVLSGVSAGWIVSIADLGVCIIVGSDCTGLVWWWW